MAATTNYLQNLAADLQKTEAAATKEAQELGANPNWLVILRISLIVINFLLSQAVSPDGRLVIPKLWRISFYIAARAMFIQIKQVLDSDETKDRQK